VVAQFADFDKDYCYWVNSMEFLVLRTPHRQDVVQKRLRPRRLEQRVVWPYVTSFRILILIPHLGKWEAKGIGVKKSQTYFLGFSTTRSEYSHTIAANL